MKYVKKLGEGMILGLGWILAAAIWGIDIWTWRFWIGFMCVHIFDILGIIIFKHKDYFEIKKTK